MYFTSNALKHLFFSSLRSLLPTRLLLLLLLDDSPPATPPRNWRIQISTGPANKLCVQEFKFSQSFYIFVDAATRRLKGFLLPLRCVTRRKLVHALVERDLALVLSARRTIPDS